jgi:hypothetical protein
LYEEGNSQNIPATFTITVASGNDIPRDRKIGRAITDEPPPDMALKNAAMPETTKIQTGSIYEAVYRLDFWIASAHLFL